MARSQTAKQHRNSDTPYLKYADCMEEIKKRTSVIDGFLTGKCHAMYVQTTAESICLQIRKVLELIALASLAANKSAYQKFRKRFHCDWHGSRILATLEKANPKFYPQPSKQVIDQETEKVVSVEPITSGYLTKSDYVELYEIFGRMLHANNPFSPKRDAQSFLDSVPQWMEKIRHLLNHHQIQLLDDDQQLWVLMKSRTDEKAHVFEFQRIGDE